MSDRWDSLLLDAARMLGSASSVAELAEHVHAVLARLPGAVGGGLVSHDSERQRFSVHGLIFAGPTGPDGRRSPAEPLEDELRDMRGASLDPLVLDLRRDAPTNVHALLRDHGATAYVDVPMTAPHRLLGLLFLALRDPPPIAADVLDALRDLARIATPSLWSCFTHEWIRRGDRRRDVLIELSRSINTTLEQRAVIREALEALDKLGPDQVAAIDLLTPDGLAVRRYRMSADATEAPPSPVSSTAVQAVLDRRATYQSDDLRERTAFEDDRALLHEGLRRYVATPLQAHGRIFGALLIASRDPYPPPRIDLWLFENIAVQIALALDNAVRHEEVQRLSRSLQEQNVYLREEIQSEHAFGEILGDSAAIREVLRAVARVAPTDSTVLITGETGVGKELVARAIHAASPRAPQPMVKINCAAIPEGTVESELFGHERGAFTSAVERRIGRFELARDGTLFLDEVGELPLPVQAKLLRVLQDGEFERVGGSKTLSSNARIIAATNRNLLHAVEAGQFRRDLYYRLNVFPIHVPPLRERADDIPRLVEAFVVQFARRMGKRIERIGPELMADLSARSWPGNIRELRHEIERALILADGPHLTLPRAAAPAMRVPVAPPKPAPRPPDDAESMPLAPSSGAGRSLDEVEAEHIRRVLASTDGVIEGPRGAARILGLTPSTLRFRMRRLGVTRTPRTSHQK